MAVRVGVIGAGGMAAYHIPGFRAGGARVVAVADVDADAAARAAAAFGVPQVYGSAAALLARADVDAVSVITPNKFHRPLVLQALRAGKHVFCEKPPALNAAETRQMAAAARRAGRTLMFDFNNRARPEAVAMMKAIRAGEAGEIRSAQALWIRRTGIPGFGGWFTTRALSGGGPVIDLLHMIDLALYFMGYPEPAYALANTYDDFMGDPRFKGPWGIPDRKGGVCDVESAAHGLVTFANGATLFLRTAWAEMNKREEVSVTFQGTRAGGCVRRLFGTDGIDETAEDVCELYRQGRTGARRDRTLKVRPDAAMGRVRAATNFIRALEGREPPLNTPDQAVKLMKVIDAVYASAARRAPVRIS